MNSTIKNYLALNHLHCISREERIFLKNHLELKENIFLDHYFLKENNFSEELITKIKAINWKLIDKEIEWSEKNNHYLITLKNNHYPALLKEISSPPVVLFVHGNINLLNQMQIAIVGSRNPTYYGTESAHFFSNQLAQFGFVITSGLAMGIDTASHQGALKKGETIAVLGNGLNSIYPKSNQKIAEKIIERGAIVSEFPLFEEPKKENFPRRNRIISGLSLGVFVIEAAQKSGSLITAKYAIEQGREVFALPGSIRSSLSKGCHELIREGAILVDNVNKIIEELMPKIKQFFSENDIQNKKNEGFESKQIIQEGKEILDDEYQKLLSCVEFEMTNIETLIQRSGFSAEKVSSMLIMLELKNLIQSVPGGVCRV